jgi:hypothetical protein
VILKNININTDKKLRREFTSIKKITTISFLSDGFTGVITVFQLLRHKILLLMIEGLARRGGAEVSFPARDDALARKRTSAAIFIGLIYL